METNGTKINQTPIQNKSKILNTGKSQLKTNRRPINIKIIRRKKQNEENPNKQEHTNNKQIEQKA